MKTLLAFAAVALLAPALFADDALVRELERTEARLLAALEDVTPEQWTFKAAPDRWSIAECVEHITAAEPFIRDLIVKSLDKPAPKDGKKDEIILTAIVDRSKKFKAPEPLIPTSKFKTKEEAIAAFQAERARTIALARSAADFRAHGMDHFALGPLDSFGWVLFLSGHSERHTLQIDEVKTAEGYPKS